MKRRNIFRTMPLFLMMAVVSMWFIISGCKKENTLEAQMDAVATQDAAETIAADIAVNNGGLLGEVIDVLNAPTATGVEGSANLGQQVTNGVVRSYDSLTGWWTITVTRERGNPAGLYYANYSRVYRIQFLNKNGVFQKFYITPNGASFDTAYTMNHRIVSGSGNAYSPKVTHHLISLTGAWVVTGTNTATVTMNTVTGSPYIRAASDTVTRLNSVRTLNNRLTLNFNNIVGPRGSGLNWHRKTSGTLTGTYYAKVTFQRGTTYNEKEINRTISITFGGEKVLLDISGTRYYVDPDTGELTQ